MPPSVKSPNLPAPFDSGLRTLAQSLDETLYNLNGVRDPRTASVPWMQPSELMSLVLDLARAVSAEAVAFRNGSRVRDGSEPGIAWRGSARSNSDAELVAKFSAGDPERAALARSALDAFDRLSASGGFGVARMTRESYLRAAMTGAVVVTYRGGAR